MLTNLRFSTLQKGLLLFWSIWLTLVATTNLLDALKQLGALPASWTLASGNYNLIAAAVGFHGAPAIVAALLFAIVILWQLLASLLFWRAFGSMLGGKPGTSDEVTRAFTVSLALWAAFLIATEATLTYTTAATHMRLLIAQIATLLLIRSKITNE